MSTCRSCGARITWLETAGGKKLPVDEDPAGDGNIIMVGTMANVYPGPEMAKALHMGQPRYVAHFATCPQAGEWRGRGATA